jgi:hypothetical protein
VRFAGRVEIARQPAALVLLAAQIDIKLGVEVRAGDVGRAARLDDGEIAALEERVEAAAVRSVTVRGNGDATRPRAASGCRPKRPSRSIALRAALALGAGTLSVGRSVV